MTQSNSLAKYFSNKNDMSNDNRDATFFDIIGGNNVNTKNFESKIDLENDFIYDYWLPLSEHKHPSQVSSVFLSPKFSSNEKLADPIVQLMNKYYGQNDAFRRILPSVDTVSADIDGLEKLIRSGCYRSVVGLTQVILQNISTSNHNIQFKYAIGIWYIRIAMLLKLKLYENADFEMKQFENFNKEEFYEKNDRKKSLVPFAFRIMAAELSMYNQKSDKSLENLCALLSQVEIILKELDKSPKAKEIWSKRRENVKMAIVNVLSNNQQFENAIRILEEILESNCCDKQEIFSCLGKIYIQVGDVVGAGEAFIKAKAIVTQEDKSSILRNFMNDGLLRIANGLYEEAYDSFKQANEMDDNIPLITNNMALCLFYAGRLRDAIKLLENQIFSTKEKQLSDGLVFNLCALYELESSQALQKKLNLLQWLNLNVGDGFYEPSLKL